MYNYLLLFIFLEPVQEPHIFLRLQRGVAPAPNSALALYKAAPAPAPRGQKHALFAALGPALAPQSC